MANNQIKLKWKLASIQPEGSIVGYLIDKKKIRVWYDGILNKQIGKQEWEYLIPSSEGVWIQISDPKHLIYPSPEKHKSGDYMSYTIPTGKSWLENNTEYEFKIYPVYNISGFYYFEKFQYSTFSSIFNFNLLAKGFQNETSYPFYILTGKNTSGNGQNIKNFQISTLENDEIFMLNTTYITEKKKIVYLLK